MSGVRIHCPNCGRCLGDTNDSIKANLNCRGCKKTVSISMKIASFKDYFSKNDDADKQCRLGDKLKV